MLFFCSLSLNGTSSILCNSPESIFLWETAHRRYLSPLFVSSHRSRHQSGVFRSVDTLPMSFSFAYPSHKHDSSHFLALCVNLTVIVLLKIFSLLSRYSCRSSYHNLCQPLKTQILGRDHVALYPRLAKKRQKFWMRSR